MCNISIISIDTRRVKRQLIEFFELKNNWNDLTYNLDEDKRKEAKTKMWRSELKEVLTVSKFLINCCSTTSFPVSTVKLQAIFQVLVLSFTHPIFSQLFIVFSLILSKYRFFCNPLNHLI